jgi:radical SAM protein with 4Fe4S-binding SPASM domain
MGLFGSPQRRLPQRNVIYEITPRCNHDCLYCYNVWKGRKPYPKDQLDTAGTIRLLNRIVDETQCLNLTISGGEPTLRDDLVGIISAVRPRLQSLNLITNGSLLNRSLIQDLSNAGVDLFEVTLLSTRPKVTNALTRASNHEKVIENILLMKEVGVPVVAVFVATKLNLPDLENTLKMDIALGVDGLMFNRFNPGGEGARHIPELLPDPKSLREALELLQTYSESYQFGISCSIPMMPCLFDMRKYPNLGHGYCLGGDGDKGYYTFDMTGRARICNHSDTVIGDINQESFEAISRKPFVKGFRHQLPPFCLNCAERATCQGGCRASAEVCRGCLTEEEPFLNSVPETERRKPAAISDR